MLTRWNEFGFGDFDRHFSVLNSLRREMDRVFGDFERGYGHDYLQASGQGLAPRLSVQDTGAELRVRAEVPGLTQKDLQITVEQSSLTIRGQRKVEEPKGYSVHRQERGQLSFARSFTLPSRIDAEKAVAELKNGVLELTLPKLAEAQPRQIQVRAS